MRYAKAAETLTLNRIGSRWRQVGPGRLRRGVFPAGYRRGESFGWLRLLMPERPVVADAFDIGFHTVGTEELVLMPLAEVPIKTQ